MITIDYRSEIDYSQIMVYRDNSYCKLTDPNKLIRLFDSIDKCLVGRLYISCKCCGTNVSYVNRIYKAAVTSTRGYHIRRTCGLADVIMENLGVMPYSSSRIYNPLIIKCKMCSAVLAQYDRLTRMITVQWSDRLNIG